MRLFNTVGPRQTGQYGMVIPRFVEAALRNDPIQVHGDGTQSRCFAHVGDVVEGLVRCLRSEDCHGQVVNLGNDEEITIGDLAARVVSETGSASEIQLVPYDAVYGDGFEDMQRRVPCLDKARRLIDYETTRNLSDVISDVANDLRDAERAESGSRGSA